MFRRLLREDYVRIGLDSADVESALRDLINRLPDGSFTESRKSDLFERVLAREKFGTTAVGEGLAFPHCFLPGIERPFALLGVSREGVGFPSLDGDPVYLIFLLVLPEGKSWESEKREILRGAEHLLRDRFIFERIKIAESAEEIYELLLREGSQAPVEAGRLAAAG